MNKTSVLILGSNGFIGNELNNFFELNNKYYLVSLNRKQLDLMDKNAVDKFFNSNNFDIVINSVSVGGSRLTKDNEHIFYQNIITFENVARHCHKFKTLIYFSSGAYTRNDFYGLSKNIIEKLAINYKNLIILRIYNCFGKSELNTRFIKTCIDCCENNKEIEIDQDKYFDFFYVYDLYKVINKIIEKNKTYLFEKIFDLCYIKKYKLSEIACLICKKYKKI